MVFGSALLVFLLFVGTPVAFVLGITATIVLLTQTELPLVLIAHRFYAGLDNFPIMAVPFFILAGVLMEAGGLSRRIVDFAAALVGWITGSLLMVAILAATAIAAMSGSGSADTAAVSAVLQPELKKRKYDVDFAAAMIAAAGSLALIIPPSISMVIIAVINNLSIGALFLAGVLPGLLTSPILMLIAYLHARRGGPQYRGTEPFSPWRVWETFWKAIPALMMIVIILGGILGGVFTPTEAAGVAAFYALLVGFFVYRELRVQNLVKHFVRAATYSCGIMMLIACGYSFTFLIAKANIPALLTAWLAEVVAQPWTFLLLVNVVFLALGCFMETLALVLVLSPVLIPIGIGHGIDPVHFALIMVYNFTIGTITPPFGPYMYVAAVVAERPISAVAKRVLWPCLGMIFVLIVITYLPDFSLWLPRRAGFLN